MQTTAAVKDGIVGKMHKKLGSSVHSSSVLKKSGRARTTLGAFGSSRREKRKNSQRTQIKGTARGFVRGGVTTRRADEKRGRMGKRESRALI